MSDDDERQRVVSVPPIARGVAFFLVGLLCMHFALTFLWNAPSNPIKDAVGDEMRGYMRPMFIQNWSLFAPNPVNAEDELLVRARYNDPSTGGERTTEWISATEAEWTLVTHNPAPSRASRLSSNLHRRLDSAWDDLSNEQQEIMTSDYTDMENWKPLADDLISAQGGETSSRVANMVRADRVATGYATQVARALWGGEIVAVQFQLRRTPVPRWDVRNEPEPEEPSRSYHDFGWRPVLVNEGQDDEAFANTMRGLQ
ncbi:DUF5819 family protein [Phytoactinopolyspora halotolerans]|uniref:Uncharacterized protein n=1 Tax=Phytoactinopolyspora halotolerans TaxID=1981512 RepID=A0A6L9SAD9_9ACTN|nr:DUF5819 family protein [Phytoactinopolyspora halotolerans]NEE00930.1 hypothetical protein [Phytoactinopolyspora halotolerans]